MKKTDPKLIGIFVLGGLMLVVAALVLFSSQDFFTPKRQFVAYFHQSVNGLNVGAPVRFRGIPVGEVLAIEGVYEPDTGNMIPRLILEFRPETLENAAVKEGEYTLFPLLLKNGLRASLKSASLLTGQLYVSLDFHPNVPIRTLGTENDKYPEMPTIDSGFDETLAKLSELPFEEVLARMGSTLAALEEILRNPNVSDALAALPGLLADADSTVVELEKFVAGELTVTAATATETLESARDSLRTLTAKLTDESLVQLDSSLAQFDKTLRQVEKRLGQDDPLSYELLTTLREVSSAARSMRGLADSLEEHPESLLRGKTSQ